MSPAGSRTTRSPVGSSPGEEPLYVPLKLVRQARLREEVVCANLERPALDGMQR